MWQPVTVIWHRPPWSVLVRDVTKIGKIELVSRASRRNDFGDMYLQNGLPV